MPPRRRGPICIESNPDWCTTPGSTGFNDIADTRNTVLVNRTTSPQGVIRMAEGGAPVLAQKGGNAKLPQPQKHAGKRLKLKMPKPASDGKTKCLRIYSWKLFGKTPHFRDVQQQTLLNCALGGLLAALANTRKGQQFIQTLIKENKASVETNFSGVATHLAGYCFKKTIKSQPQLKTKKYLISKRYFGVSIEKKVYNVSSVLYTDDADRNWSLIYMTSPNNALWPVIIEKAYAKKVGGYEELDAVNAQKPITINDYWKQLCGSSPKFLEVKTSTKLSQIHAATKKAESIPTVAISKKSATNVTGWHTFTVLKLSRSNIKLYDPFSAKDITLSSKNFRKNFEYVFYGNPK